MSEARGRTMTATYTKVKMPSMEIPPSGLDRFECWDDQSQMTTESGI